MPAKRFRIALSFAGERRHFVEEVAAILAKQFGKDRILYDKFHEAEFANADLAFDLPAYYKDDSDLIVAVFCPDYESKEWCGLEWRAIFSLIKEGAAKQVLLSRFEKAEGKGLYGLGGVIELDQKTPEQATRLILERLALNEGHPRGHYLPDDLKGAVLGTDLELSGLSDRCPFRGLEPFREEDSPFFFGRSAVVAELSERVEGSKLVAVVGSSGSGKSSVTLAGLIPALRKQRAPRTTWEAVSFSPGTAPFACLARALVEWLDPDLGSTKQILEAADLADQLEHGRVRLTDCVQKGLATWGAKRLLLVIDQFEELLTQVSPEAQRPFVQVLLAALDKGPVVLLPTIRADFYGAACDLDADFSALVERGVFNLRRPTPEELREAISEPARLVGLRYEPELLVDKLLDDVGDEPGNLPLLEYALLELWNQRQRGKLHASKYEAMGGLGGAIAASAERVYARFESSQHQQVRKLFVRLVQTSPTTGGLENTRRRALVTDLDPEARPVIQDFAAPDVRLLVTSQDETGHETVEVAHERLISAWQRFQGWLAEDIEFRLWRQRLAPSLEYFQENPADLLTGSALEEARRWLEKAAPDLAPREKQFVEESIEKERRQARKKRDIGVATTAFAVVFFALAIGFYFTTRKARAEEGKARSAEATAKRESSRTSYSAALAAIDEDRPDLALPHLVKAIRLDPEWGVPRDLALSVLQVTPVPRAGMSTRSDTVRFGLVEEEIFFELARDGTTGRILDPQTGRQLLTLSLLVRPAKWTSFSAASGRLVTESEEGEIQVWDLATGAPVGPRLTQPNLWFAKLSADGRLIITQTERDVRIWEAQTGALIGGPWPNGSFGIHAALAPAVRRLLTSPTEQTLQTWDIPSGKPLGPALHSEKRFTEARLSPDGHRIASVARREWSKGDSFQIWDAASGQQLGARTAEIYRLRLGDFSADSHRLVTYSIDGTAQLWNAKTGQPLGGIIHHEQDIVEAEFSSDSRRLLTSSLDGTVRLWDAATGSALGPPLGYSPGRLPGRFSTDSRRVYSLGQDGTPLFWRAPASPSAIPLRREQGIGSLAVSPDGQVIAMAARNSPASVWNVRAGQLRSPPLRLCEGASAVTFSPNNRLILAACPDKTLRTWSLESGAPSGLPLRAEDRLQDLSFSPDSRLILTTTFKGAQVRHIASGQLKSRIGIADQSIIERATFSPDGRLVTTSDYRSLKMWDLSVPEPVGVPLEGTGSIRDFAYSPTGDRLVVGRLSGWVQLWDANARIPIGRSFGHTKTIQSIEFSPSGGSIATASADGTARIWSAYWREPETAPLRHDGPVTAAHFSQDGRRLLTTSQDGIARLWDVRDGLPVALSMKHGKEFGKAYFALNDQVVVTLSDGKAFLWPVFTSRPEDAELIADLAEAVSGQVAGPTGLEPIENWRERQDRVIKLVENAPLGEATAASLGRWLFMDPWERPVSPLFTLSVEQYICDALRYEAWDEAYRYFPGHPLLGNGPEDPLPAACATAQ